MPWYANIVCTSLICRHPSKHTVDTSHQQHHQGTPYYLARNVQEQFKHVTTTPPSTYTQFLTHSHLLYATICLHTRVYPSHLPVFPKRVLFMVHCLRLVSEEISLTRILQCVPMSVPTLYFWIKKLQKQMFLR